eukprot:scaffold94188_cov22-Tisochrysis_lutea.AAC.2
MKQNIELLSGSYGGGGDGDVGGVDLGGLRDVDPLCTGLRSSTIDSAKKERHQKKMQAAARHRREQLQQALE